MSAAVRAAQVPVLRAVPWRRLAWVAWRHYRLTLIVTAALLALLGLYILVRGHAMREAYAAAQACTPVTSPACRFANTNFHHAYSNPGFLGGLWVFVPALLGAFTGAPLLARELETGTFRFAWTQGAGRMRWLIGLLAPGALGVAAAGAAFGLMVSWYNEPLVEGHIVARIHSSVFAVTGLAVMGWALLGFAIGVLAGFLVRRAVPAIGITLALWTGFAFLASLVRQHYAAPLVTNGFEIPQSAQAVEQWWTHGTTRVSEADLNQVLQALGVQMADSGNDYSVGPGGGGVDPVQYLVDHGYTQWTSFQPDSRYWPFQLLETGWLLALTLALIALTLGLVRGRNN